VLLARSAVAETDNDPDRFKMLHQYALIADSAYQDKTSIEKVLAAQGYTLTDHGQLPGYAVSYFLATNDAEKQQIISVRGTSNI